MEGWVGLFEKCPGGFCRRGVVWGGGGGGGGGGELIAISFWFLLFHFLWCRRGYYSG